jgi:branched-chain amino acid transport system permease protein
MTPSLSPRAIMAASARWRVAEFVFWPAAYAVLVLFPSKALLFNQIAILGLFALSLDLILGYAGIVSLGQAAFFGLGAYTAGLLAKFGYGDPFLGLGAAALTSAALGLLTSFLLLRGSDLTRLMVTLGVGLMLLELANRMAWLTGGADGLQGIEMKPILGIWEFDIYGKVAYLYSLTILLVLFLLARRIVHSPFGLSLKAVKGNVLRSGAIGISPASRLVAIYTIAAAFAGVAGALSAQTTQFVSLEYLDFQRSADVMLVLVIGGIGYLYGGLIGAILFRFMQDWLSGITPQYWEFWIGFVLVVLVLIGHDRITRHLASLGARLSGLWRTGGSAP